MSILECIFGFLSHHTERPTMMTYSVMRRAMRMRLPNYRRGHHNTDEPCNNLSDHRSRSCTSRQPPRRSAQCGSNSNTRVCGASWNAGMRVAVASRVRKVRTEKQPRCGSTARIAVLYRSATSDGWNCDRGYGDCGLPGSLARVAGLIACSVTARVESLRAYAAIAPACRTRRVENIAAIARSAGGWALPAHGRLPPSLQACVRMRLRMARLALGRPSGSISAIRAGILSRAVDMLRARGERLPLLRASGPRPASDDKTVHCCTVHRVWAAALLPKA